MQSFVKVLASILRPCDIIGRFGGEEFMVLLPETNQEKAFYVAERVRQQIEAMSIPLEENSMKITVSIGVAQLENLEEDDKTLENWIAKADKRLSRKAGTVSSLNKPFGSPFQVSLGYAF